MGITRDRTDGSYVPAGVVNPDLPFCDQLPRLDSCTIDTQGEKYLERYQSARIMRSYKQDAYTVVGKLFAKLSNGLKVLH